MSADGLFLRDFIERGLLAFEIPYFYASGEVMEVDVPTSFQPLFCGRETLELSFGEETDDSDGTERVMPGAQVLDGMTRLLEGDRNTLGQAVVVQRDGSDGVAPEAGGRINVLNAPIVGSRAVSLYEPIIKIDVRVRSIVDRRVQSQAVPVFYDVAAAAIVDGAPLCKARIQDVDELERYDGRILRRPSADELANAAAAAVAHLQATFPPMPPSANNMPSAVDLSLVRILVLYRPVNGLELQVRDRRTKKEFTLTFGADPHDATSITPVPCSSCRRAKGQFYLSHRTGQLLCTDCSMLCVGCWAAYDLDGRNCELCSKRRYCPDCLAECGCGTLICPDHAVEGTSDDVHCPDCAPAIVVEPVEEGSESASSDRAASSDRLVGQIDFDAVLSGNSTPTPTPSQPAREDDDSDDVFGDSPSVADPAEPEAPSGPPGFIRVRSMRDIFKEGPTPEEAFAAAKASANDEFFDELDEADELDELDEADDDDPFFEAPPSDNADTSAMIPIDEGDVDIFADEPVADAFEPTAFPTESDDNVFVEDVFAPTAEAIDSTVDLPPPPDATGFTHEDDPDAERIVADREGYAEEDATAGTIGQGTIACTCHGEHRRVEDLSVDFLTGRYYCPDEIEQCSECDQSTAYDFLEGDPPRCFYCTNRMPLNLDPEAEEIFKREIQASLPFKYRMTSNAQVARSPHHLAYFIKPLVGREMIVYWDLWTSTVLLEDTL